MTTPSDPAPRVRAEGLLVDTVALLRWPGSRCDVIVDEGPAELSTSVARATHVTGTLVAESMADSLSVTGTVAAEWEGTCRRCLDDATGSVDVEIREIYERQPVEGETYPLPDDHVDLRPMLEEQVVLTLPLAPLCAEDCAGPAPETFPATVEPDEEPEPQGDPRWAALDALEFDEPTE